MPETLFTAANASVLPAWLLLLAAPRWKWTERLVMSGLWSGVLAVAYVVLVACNWRHLAGGMLHLADIARLFQQPYCLLAGWVHYLAMDLFVGAWQARDAARIGLPRLAVAACLALTFLLGPAGLLSYLVLRWAMARRAPLAT
jgi:hypothetical protein